MTLLAAYDRPTRRSRRRPAGPVVEHAVPDGDRTRTALCGASVTVEPVAFDAVPTACPDCAATASVPGQALAA